MFYLGLATSRAFVETRKFWNIHQIWAFGSVPVSGFLLHALIRKSRLDGWHEVALFAVFGFIASWLGSYLINLIHVPAILHHEQAQIMVGMERDKLLLQNTLDARSDTVSRLNLEVESLMKPKRTEEFMEARSDLIYDVGLFDGGDTAYYLFRGYNVVAIDANPLMVEQAKVRFSKEIQDKRLTLLNVGISETPGTAIFWVSQNAEWSSFSKTLASRIGTAHRPFEVSTVPFAQILAEHGVPHYLKIDIEGNDRLCVDALRGITLPKYVSVESGVGDSEVGSGGDAMPMLELLRDIGYRRFKLVKQGEWSYVRSNTIARLWVRFVTSAARGRFRVKGLSEIADRFTDSTRIAAALGFSFSPISSGPWGDDIPGAWMTFEKARSIYLRETRSTFSRDRGYWYDWHATY